VNRRKRIAKGSGTSVEQVGQLIKQFTMMRKMMKNSGIMGRLLSGGGVPGLGRPGFRDGVAGAARGSNYTPPKKKRKKH